MNPRNGSHSPAGDNGGSKGWEGSNGYCCVPEASVLLLHCSYAGETGVCRRKMKCKLLRYSSPWERSSTRGACLRAGLLPLPLQQPGGQLGSAKQMILCTCKSGWLSGADRHPQSGLSLGQFLLTSELIPGPAEGPLQLWKRERCHYTRYY